MFCDPRSKAMMFGWWAAYAVLLVLSIVALHFTSPPWPVLKVAIALVPTIPLFGILNGSMNGYRQADELQKRIIAEGIMFGFGTTAILTLSYGFLQANDLAPDVSFTWVWPILGAAWLVGMLIARRRYQ
jgi:hypothetical protein